MQGRGKGILAMLGKMEAPSGGTVGLVQGEDDKLGRSLDPGDQAQRAGALSVGVAPPTPTKPSSAGGPSSEAEKTGIGRRYVWGLPHHPPAEQLCLQDQGAGGPPFLGDFTPGLPGMRWLLPQMALTGTCA